MGKRLKRFHCPECDSTDLLFSTWNDEYGVKPEHMTIKKAMVYCINCDKRVEEAKYRKPKKQKASQT